MSDNAKIFSEMRDADAIKKDMQENILKNAYKAVVDKLTKTVGPVYDWQLTRTGVNGLHDAYRRIAEQGFYGKDVFDGRFHMDNGNIMDLDQRAAVYGVGTGKSQDNSQEQGKGTGKEQETNQDKSKEAEAAKQIEQNRDRDRDRDDDLEIGR
jgi:hypothetical protein